MFRDDANLAANPDLWDGIEQALAASEWLVLLASPQAAESPWVGREIRWWLENRSPERILIGVTSGHLAWDSAAGDFDAGSSAVHPELRGVLTAEPRWIDLRGVRSLPRLDDDDPRVQEALAEFAAPLRGVAKDELVGEHLRRRRRERRRVRNALILFVVLSMVAAGGGAVAYLQGQRAAEQARVATARLLAVTAVQDSPIDAGRAGLLAAEGYRINRDPQTVAAMFRVVNDNPDLIRQHTLAEPVTALVAAPNGVVVAATESRLVRWDPRDSTSTWVDLRGAGRVTGIATNEDGTVVAANSDAAAVVWHVGGELVELGPMSPLDVTVSPSGESVVVLSWSEGDSWLTVFEASTGAARAGIALPYGPPGELFEPHYWTDVGIPDEQTVVATGVKGTWQRRRLADLEVTVYQDTQVFPSERGVRAFSDDGSFTGLFLGAVSVYDTAHDQNQPDGSILTSLHTAAVFGIRRDGKRSAWSEGERLFVADVVGRGEPDNRVELLGSGGASHVAFVGASNRLVTAKSATLSLWDPGHQSRLRLDSGALPVPSTSGASSPIRMAVSPDGQRVLLVGTFGDVVLYDLLNEAAAGAAVTPPQPDTGAYFPAWLPDGTPVLIGEYGCDVYAIHGNTTETLLESQDMAVSVARLTNDGRHLVCVSKNGGMTTRRLGDKGYVSQIPGNDKPLRSGTGNGEVGVAAISADGRYAAWIAGLDEDAGTGQLTVVDSQEGTTVTVLGPSETVNYAGGRLLVSQADGSLDVRDLSGAHLIRTIPSSVTYARPLAWVPGTSFVGRMGNDGRVTIVDVDSGAVIGTLPLQNPESVTGQWAATALVGVDATGELVAASPDGEVTRWVVVNEPGWLELICWFAGRDLNAAEWRHVTGAEPPGDLRCRR